MKKPSPGKRCAASFEWRRNGMVLTLSLGRLTVRQVEAFQGARIQIGAAHSRSVVFLCYSVDGLTKGQAPYNLHALPREEWPEWDPTGRTERLPLTVKLHDAARGTTCAERVVILSYRVSEALVLELRGQAERPVGPERFEMDLAEALSWIKTPSLHACAMMDIAAPPKLPSRRPAGERPPHQREEDQLNELYNAPIDCEHFRDAVNAIDELTTIREDLETLRARLLALDGIHSSDNERDGRSVWDLAEDLSAALSESLETLGKTDDILDKIVMLDPRNQEVKEGR